MLDLRGNPGGLLNVAVEIAERFIDAGIGRFHSRASPGADTVAGNPRPGQVANAHVRPGRPR